MTAALGNPYALGATGVLTTARTDRVSMGASFRPASAALAAVTGFLAGPANTQGELTLVSDALLRVAPFTAIVQGTRNSLQGQYIVANGVQRDLAVPAKDASQSRRALIVVRVGDSLEAGVASSPTTDGAWLEIIPGALASSNPALPAAPADSLVAGELLIPSTGSGQPVTLTRYNPRTTVRGGILPVLAGPAVTTPGYEGAPGNYFGEYRDHPTLGLQRWNGSLWETVRAGAWVDLVRSTTYDHTLPVTGTPAFIPGAAGHTIAVPAGRTLEVEFRVPRWECSPSVSGFARILIDGTSLDAALQLSSAAVNGPLRLRASKVSTGAGMDIHAQAWCTGNVSRFFAAGDIGGAVVYRYRIT